MKFKRTLDWPIRVFHILFMVLFIFSFYASEFISDKDDLYAYHMISGSLMFTLILFRCLWGFYGSETAKFKHFKLSLTHLKSYADNFESTDNRFDIFNPINSWMNILIYFTTLAILGSGVFLLFRFRDMIGVHIYLSYFLCTLLVFYFLHIIVHSIVKKDSLISIYFTGKSAGIDKQIAPCFRTAAVLFVFLGLQLGYIYSRYNNKTGNLRIRSARIELVRKSFRSPSYKRLLKDKS